MFNDIGVKIKNLAIVQCWIEIIASVVVGYIIIERDEPLIGFAIMIGGSLLAWIGSFILYGFGELIDTARRIAYNTAAGYRGISDSSKVTCSNDIYGQKSANDSYELKKLLEEGLITEKEYEKVLSKNNKNNL